MLKVKIMERGDYYYLILPDDRCGRNEIFFSHCVCSLRPYKTVLENWGAEVTTLHPFYFSKLLLSGWNEFQSQNVGSRCGSFTAFRNKVICYQHTEIRILPLILWI